jgi:4-amino-4-deoxychorismate lyase
MGSVVMSAGRFDLIETMAFDPEQGLLLLDLHVARLDRSASALGFRFDRHALRNELQAATFALMETARVRALLGPDGEMAIEVREKLSWPRAIVPVSIQKRAAPSHDVRVNHKTTDRSIYADALKAGGTAEVLLVDAEGYLTEGTYSNLFVAQDDKLLTPPLSRGLLPGVLRQSLLDRGEAIEADLKPCDLEGDFFIGNASRGMVAARLVAPTR